MEFLVSRWFVLKGNLSVSDIFIWFVCLLATFNKRLRTDWRERFTAGRIRSCQETIKVTSFKFKSGSRICKLDNKERDIERPLIWVLPLLTYARRIPLICRSAQFIDDAQTNWYVVPRFTRMQVWQKCNATLDSKQQIQIFTALAASQPTLHDCCTPQGKWQTPIKHETHERVWSVSVHGRWSLAHCHIQSINGSSEAGWF